MEHHCGVFLSFRHHSAMPFRGLCSAMKSALPALEEAYVAYSDERSPEIAKSELSAFLEARASTLRRFAVGGEALAGVSPSDIKSFAGDLRLGLTRHYNFDLSRPEGVDEWHWTWFGLLSPLCPPSRIGSSSPLTYSDSFLILPKA